MEIFTYGNIIRTDEQLKRLIKNIVAVNKFLDGMDQKKHRDLFYAITRTDETRMDFIFDVLREHNFYEAKVTQYWLEHKYLSPLPYDRDEFYEG